jgi:hypothetical protein
VIQGSTFARNRASTGSALAVTLIYKTDEDYNINY